MVLLSIQVQAQTRSEGFRMGLALDPNISWMSSSDLEHTTNGIRAHFGYHFMADILFTETYAFGTGVNVFRTGSNVEYWEPTTDSTLSHVSRSFNNQYVEVPLTFKLRTKEIGYTTYFGQFGGGVGLNTRREAEESRYVAFERNEGTWLPTGEAAAQPQDLISGNFASLFRASLIVGMGFERRIAGTTSLMVGFTYNSSLFSTHKGQMVVEENGLGEPCFGGDEPLQTQMEGHDSFLAMTLGVVF